LATKKEDGKREKERDYKAKRARCRKGIVRFRKGKQRDEHGRAAVTLP